MQETREQVVTTTTTDSVVPARMPPIISRNPWAETSERVAQVTVDPYARRRSALYIMRQAIWLVFGLVEGLIAIRFVLRLLGASPTAGFADLIYGVTAPLVAPFVGLFGTPRFEGSALEVTSIVAIIIYALLGWALIKVITMLSSERGTAGMLRDTYTRIQ